MAQVLSNSRAVDYIELSDELSISEFHLTKSFEGKRVVDVDFCGTYGLKIITVVTIEKTIVEIDSSMILHDANINLFL